MFLFSDGLNLNFKISLIILIQFKKINIFKLMRTVFIILRILI